MAFRRPGRPASDSCCRSPPCPGRWPTCNSRCHNATRRTPVFELLSPGKSAETEPGPTRPSAPLLSAWLPPRIRLALSRPYTVGRGGRQPKFAQFNFRFGVELRCVRGPIAQSNGLAVKFSGSVLCGAALPLRVQFGDRRADRESPRENREAFELVRHGVAMRGLFRRHSCLVHFLRLFGNVVEHRALRRDSFLLADLSVAGHENRVLVERRE